MQSGGNSTEKQSTVSLEAALRKLTAKLSLQKVFSVLFIVQFMVAAGIIAGLLFYGGRQAVDAVLKEMQREVLARVYEHLSQHMEEPLHLNRMNADAWRSGLLDLSDPVRREQWFANHIRVSSDMAMTFIGLTDGSFYGARRKASGDIQVVRNNTETRGDSWYYAVSPQGYAGAHEETFRRFDPRTRDWYQSAERSGRPTFSGIYRHFVFREPTVTAAHPVFDAEGILVGVFGTDYLLSWLDVALEHIFVGTSGQIFITDTDGFLVATSTPQRLFLETDGRLNRVQAIDSADPLLRLAVQSLGNGSQDELGEIAYEQRSFLAGRKAFQMSGLDWRIYVLLAHDDFLGGMNKAINGTIIVTILASIGFSFMAVWTAGWVTRPILRLNEAARELAKGRLRSVPDTDRQDEFGQLARSFNVMARRMTDLLDSLELKVIERTRALAELTGEEQRLRALLHAELEKAGEEQRSMLPPDIDQSRLCLKIIYEPSLLVSGDFCWYQWLEDGDILLGYIIDVTGHGAATALRTAAISVMLQETLQAEFSLAERTVELNKRIASYLRDDNLVAGCGFELDLKQKKLSYIAAGITEFFADSAAVNGRIKTPGSFLGLCAQPEFKVMTIPIQAGDIFCFYSDGLADKLEDGGSLPAHAGFETVVQAVRSLSVTYPLRDDCTAMCIQIGSLD